MRITTIGIDLAKNVFQIHGANEHGKAVLRKQLRRDQVSAFFANLEPCLIGMEACGSAHHWARKLQGFGHAVRLMAPQIGGHAGKLVEECDEFVTPDRALSSGSSQCITHVSKTLTTHWAAGSTFEAILDIEQRGRTAALVANEQQRGARDAKIFGLLHVFDLATMIQECATAGSGLK